MRYPIVIHKDPDSDYGVTVPDLPGCFSAGETLDDALIQATEAIECHLEALILDDEPIPTSNPLEYHQNNPDYADGIWAVVTVDRAKLNGPELELPINLDPQAAEFLQKVAVKRGVDVQTIVNEWIRKEIEIIEGVIG